MYFVYILQCKDTSLYTGITTDVQRRFLKHQDGKGGHYTLSHPVTRILYTEEHPDKSSALKREIQLKSWPREKKWDLINGSL